MKSESFEIQASEWFNTSAPLNLMSLKGRVVILGAFQMLCPACVAHSIPQMKKLHRLFREAPVTVIGLHTVFEHHEAMQPVSLKAFIHEYRLEFPIGVDAPSGEAIPLTMQSLKLQGTPSTVIWDGDGRIRFHQFGHVDDLALGASIGQLVAETTQASA